MVRDRRFKHAAGMALVLAAGGLLAGCGGGSMFGSSSGPSSPSLGDRFSQLFGSKSEVANASAGPSTQETEDSDLSCPSVSIRTGASTLAVGLPGKLAAGNDLRYQGTIVRTARDCSLSAKQIKARVGVQGRIIVGPAGAPATIDVPVRVAVVQDGAPEKVILTKVYRTSVAISPEDSNVDFSVVAEDLVYPAPTPSANDKYVFYVGFDPIALKPEPVSRNQKKK